jgi:hypothetical protein
MDFLASFAAPFLQFFKNLVHLGEIKKFKSALRRNPQDHYLRSRFAKYCLQHYFHGGASGKTLSAEAVRQFESIPASEITDLEVYCLIGKFYREKDKGKAVEVYKRGVRQYNELSEKNAEFKKEGAEPAFVLVVNWLRLDPNVSDPELEKFFHHVRKTSLVSFLAHQLDIHSSNSPQPSSVLPAAN